MVGFVLFNQYIDNGDYSHLKETTPIGYRVDEIVSVGERILYENGNQMMHDCYLSDEEKAQYRPVRVTDLSLYHRGWGYINSVIVEGTIEENIEKINHAFLDKR